MGAADEVFEYIIHV